MGYFKNILQQRNLTEHDGRPLWKYALTDEEFQELKQILKQSAFVEIDSRDATLYFAEWFKRNYNGRIPSKEGVFNSLGRTTVSQLLYPDSFYDLARRGADKLGIRWIRKQNTLKLRTLLLQGGIPLNHIAANAGAYQIFLERLLELRPNSVEEIEINNSVTNILPPSSRNEIIYENCLEIINSYINNEEDYIQLFERNDKLKAISDNLKVKRKNLTIRPRHKQPSIFWTFSHKAHINKFYLKIGFGDLYTPEALQQLLSLENLPTERLFQLYFDNKQICSFRKLLSGNYKTQWESDPFLYWDEQKIAPQFYYLVENGNKQILSDLLAITPTLDEPTLWLPLNDDEFRLVKGFTTNSDEGIVIFPDNFELENDDLPIQTLFLHNKKLSFVKFENTLIVKHNQIEYIFETKASTFDYTIISQMPHWMNNSNLNVICGGDIRVFVYDVTGQRVANLNYQIYYRKNKSEAWKMYLNGANLGNGIIELKIVYNNDEAFDTVYNIGKLDLDIINPTINQATLSWNNLGSFRIEITESRQINVTLNNNQFHLTLKTDQQIIPTSIIGKIKFGSEKALYFDIESPFRGIGLLDEEGNIMPNNAVLSLINLYGYRLLTPNHGETLIKIFNGLRQEVKVFKNIIFSQQPLISFKEHLHRLFYLADAMNYQNKIVVEVKNGQNNFVFCVKGFSHSIDSIDNDTEGKVFVTGYGNIDECFAIPLNVESNSITEILMNKDEDSFFSIPKEIPRGQFIVISKKINGRQLQPRFINTDPSYIQSSKDERIMNYRNELLRNDYKSECWQILKSYFNICLQYEIPFSTFDQIRAISIDSVLAAKAFFFFGIHQFDINEYIQIQIPLIEQDLGFCFHWVNKMHWDQSLDLAVNFSGVEFSIFLQLFKQYFEYNSLDKLCSYILGQQIDKINVLNDFINQERGQLGSRVLKELPIHNPHITNAYGIPLHNHEPVKLLLRAPIAVAESIAGNQEKSIWSNDAFIDNIRRNIQYTLYIAPNLYTQVLYHTFSRLN